MSGFCACCLSANFGEYKFIYNIEKYKNQISFGIVKEIIYNEDNSEEEDIIFRYLEENNFCKTLKILQSDSNSRLSFTKKLCNFLNEKQMEILNIANNTDYKLILPFLSLFIQITDQVKDDILLKNDINLKEDKEDQQCYFLKKLFLINTLKEKFSKKLKKFKLSIVDENYFCLTKQLFYHFFDLWEEYHLKKFSQEDLSEYIQGINTFINYLRGPIISSYYMYDFILLTFLKKNKNLLNFITRNFSYPIFSSEVTLEDYSEIKNLFKSKVNFLITGVIEEHKNIKLNLLNKQDENFNLLIKTFFDFNAKVNN